MFFFIIIIILIFSKNWSAMSLSRFIFLIPNILIIYKCNYWYFLDDFNVFLGYWLVTGKFESTKNLNYYLYLDVEDYLFYFTPSYYTVSFLNDRNKSRNKSKNCFVSLSLGLLIIPLILQNSII